MYIYIPAAIILGFDAAVLALCGGIYVGYALCDWENCIRSKALKKMPLAVVVGVLAVAVIFMNATAFSSFYKRNAPEPSTHRPPVREFNYPETPQKSWPVRYSGKTDKAYRLVRIPPVEYRVYLC